MSASRPQGVIMVGRDLDEDEWSAAVELDQRPRHYAFDLARIADLRIQSSADVAVSGADRALGVLIGRSTAWSVARATAHTTEPNDFVYATDESLGIPYILLSNKRRTRARSMAMFVLAPHRFRTRVWLTLLRRLRLLPGTLVVGVPETADALRAQLAGRAPNTVVEYFPVTVDDRFFRPGVDVHDSTRRPLVISAGLEQRDYRRLAEATRDLDVDVDVCAVSPDRAGSKTVLPAELPENMQFAPLSMQGLRDLYQRADLFVLSTSPNSMGAGLTAVMEALASGLDVVASIAEDDLAELGADGLVTRTADTTPESLRALIVERLEHRDHQSRTPRVRLTADDYVADVAGLFSSRHGIALNSQSPESTTDYRTVPAIQPDLISVVIPVAGADDSLITQLQALFDQETASKFEVVISHNQPSDEDRARLTELVTPFENEALWVIEANGRAGAAYARNAGARAARGARLLFCDADDVVHPGWIDAFATALDSHDAVTGRIVEIAPDGQDDWRPPATPGGLPTFHGAPYVLSGNLAIRRSAFESVGGFDETLTRCEDIALGWALQNRGHEIAYSSDAVLDYHHRAGLRRMLKQHYLYGRGMAEVLAKYPNPLHSSGDGSRSKLALLKPNAQPHRRTAVSELRRVAIGLGRVVGLVARG